MKRISTYLMGISLLSVTTLSCTKDAQNETARQQAVAPQVINANVPLGQTYVLNMSAGTTASIVTQAQHYQLSEIATVPRGSVYKYIAQKGYAGADEVTLQQTTTATTQSSGCHRNQSSVQASTSFNTLVIKFNVAN